MRGFRSDKALECFWAGTDVERFQLYPLLPKELDNIPSSRCCRNCVIGEPILLQLSRERSATVSTTGLEAKGFFDSGGRCTKVLLTCVCVARLVECEKKTHQDLGTQAKIN